MDLKMVKSREKWLSPGVREAPSASCELAGSQFFKARARKHTESSILEVARLGNRLQLRLKEVFPDRAGKFCSKFELSRILVFDNWEF